MKNKLLSLLSFIVLIGGTLCIGTPCAYAENFTSGKDWVEHLSEKEKIIAIVAPTMVLHRYGIPIEKSTDEYVSKIDKVIEKNPNLNEEDISNIFASTVYYYEPATRKPLEELELAFLRGETSPEMKNALPRLSIKQLSREALEEVQE